MERAVFVYTTWPSIVEAEAAGRDLVGLRLAACVNILPGMIAIYRWQGAVERADEVAMIVKTRAGLVGDLQARVRVLHPYDTPAFAVLPVEQLEPGYAAWLLTETDPSP